MTIDEARIRELSAFFLYCTANMDAMSDDRDADLMRLRSEWRILTADNEKWRKRLETFLEHLTEAGISMEIKNKRALTRGVAELLTVPAREAYRLQDIFEISPEDDKTT